VLDVVGKDRDEAERLLETRRLQVAFTEREDGDEEPGTVLQMNPVGGTEVERNTTVTLTVAKEPKQLEVPDVLGEEADAAARLVERAGFRVRRREQIVDGPEGDGVVLEQTPPSGEKRDKGSRVILTIGRFEPPENLDPDPGATPAPTP
jgi:eukaryotic-like serine/threonine-protein kinase